MYYRNTLETFGQTKKARVFTLAISLGMVMALIGIILTPVIPQKRMNAAIETFGLVQDGYGNVGESMIGDVTDPENPELDKVTD